MADKEKKSKLGKLVGTAVGLAAAGPILFSSLGWMAVVICASGAVAATILIVKELKRK